MALLVSFLVIRYCIYHLKNLCDMSCIGDLSISILDNNLLVCVLQSN